MKIARIQIDRFGPWRNLDLPLDPSGITVLYGPNEAGKSTLLKFIRGVLYGFPVAEIQTRESEFLGGTLHVVHDGRPLEISRRRGDGASHRLAVNGWDRAVPAEEILHELTAGTSRQTFQNLFALGLPELQQLATLHASEVAERMYGATLGADGKRLLAAIREGGTRRGELVAADGATGTIAELMERDAALAVELHDLGSQRDEYDRLCRERSRLANVIDEMKSRQAGMQSQLRGHRFLQRIWDPWSQVRDCERELADVPVVNVFPDDGLQRLRQIDAEIDSDTRCRNALLKESEELEARRQSLLPDLAALRHIRMLRRFVDRRERIERIAAERAETQQKVDAERRAVDDACRNIGENWDRERLKSVDLSPARQHELLRAASAFQKSVVRSGRFRGIYKRASESFRKLRARVEQGREQFGDQTVAAAMEREQQRLERSRFEHRAAELRQRRDELQQMQERDGQSELVPRWFRRVLWFFTVAGGIVAATGLLTAFTVNAWSGLVLGLAGATGLGVGWGLQLQTESAARDANESRRRELAQLETELQEIRRAGSVSDRSDETQTADETRETTIADLVALQSHHRLCRRFERRRRRMTQLRHRFAALKQDFSHAREQWCDAQTRAGLDVALKLDDAFAHWQRVFEIREQLARLRSAERTASRAERRRQNVMHAMRVAAATMQFPLDGTDDPVRVLDDWQHRLEELEAARDEARRLRGEIRTRRHEARQYSRHLRKLNRRLDALLVQGGAADRDEFEQRADAVARRAELEELLEMAREELATVAAAEPELAIVEEDLAAYDAADHAECIRALELELSDLAGDLESAHEELGSVKQALAELATDESETKLQIQRSRMESKIVAALEAWLAEGIVAQTLDVVRARFERTHQPAVLAAASHYLYRFTRGRYPRVWTPLGRNRLFVDDRWDAAWDLDELSGGTREQVFLALRLALVDDAAQRGVELPFILDDVLVNFDRQRTEAAVETLQHVAAAGRQILFLTCHEHVAEAFRRIGVTPLELPNRPRERRIAG